MASPAPASAPVTPALARAFLEIAGPEAKMTFDRFMELALFHPEVGYYRGDRRRVGRAPGTDFFTASNTEVFGELVQSACVSLLEGENPADYTFVEIGAEPGSSVLRPEAHAFGRLQVLRLGEPLNLTGRCVVFSNELFDAQPCRRFRVEGGCWREIGVRLAGGHLHETVFPDAITAPWLPPPVGPEGLHFDAPRAAVDLMRQIANQPWSGVFVAFDYGKESTTVLASAPQGTVRAYYQHQLTNELLARAGEQDLTCHVYWDWLQLALQEAGFTDVAVESQERFFVTRAAGALQALLAAEAGRLSTRKMSVMQLLHPAHMGQAFQVLRGRKAEGGRTKG